MVKQYSNQQITLDWKPNLCIHSKKCWLELGSVFNPHEKPWIKMDGATTEEIIQQINNCPSGALSFNHNNQEKMSETPQAEFEMKIVPNGPILCQGNVTVTLPDGTTKVHEGKVSLCRCGASANKPYCDGKHREIGFEAS